MLGLLHNETEPYPQEDSDEGLKLAHLLVRLCNDPTTISKTDWKYLDSFSVGMVQREAECSRTQVFHMANQIDRMQSEVTRGGRVSYFTDALMFWIIGGSLCLAGFLLALTDLPGDWAGKVIVTVSFLVGFFIIFLPFISRRRAIRYQKKCLKDMVVDILGTGLMQRPTAITCDLIQALGKNTNKTVAAVIKKFLQVSQGSASETEILTTASAILSNFNMKEQDLPFSINKQPS